jgi:hypothetical protein
MKPIPEPAIIINEIPSEGSPLHLHHITTVGVRPRYERLMEKADKSDWGVIQV